MTSKTRMRRGGRSERIARKIEADIKFNVQNKLHSLLGGMVVDETLGRAFARLFKWDYQNEITEDTKEHDLRPKVYFGDDKSTYDAFYIQAESFFKKKRYKIKAEDGGFVFEGFTKE